MIDGVLHARLRRDGTLPGNGSVALGNLPDGVRLRLGGADITCRAEGDRVVVSVPDGPAVDLVALP